MKRSHYTTPRQMADATWTTGHPRIPRAEKFAGGLLAIFIGVAFALLLIHSLAS